MRGLPSFVAIASILVMWACGHAPTENFKTLCTTRVAWPNTATCTKCITSVKMPDCNCYEHPKLSACFETFGNVSRDCTDDATRCALACAGDCECLDGCYAKEASCATAAQVNEACIVDSCAEFCK